MKSFNERVYEIVKRIPAGRVSTYGEVARVMKTKGYRAVGNALNKNPYAPIVACHRIVNSQGHLHGFASGLKDKARLLEREGIKIKNNKVENFEKVYNNQNSQR